MSADRSQFLQSSTFDLQDARAILLTENMRVEAFYFDIHIDFI